MKIYFTGFMGSGKSSVGLDFSKRMNLNYIDLDNYIENKEGRSINTIFNIHGEDFFRFLELEYLNNIINNQDSMVVSLGGGTVQSLEMLNKLKKEGCLIYLKASEEIIKKRLNGALNSRPLLKDLSNKDLDIFFKNKISERSRFYLQSHLTIDTDNLSIVEISEICESFILNYNFVNNEK